MIQLVLLIACIGVVAAGEYDEICMLFKDGTILRKPGSCTEYISCNNQMAEVYMCPAPTSSYDRNTQSCVIPASSAAIGGGSTGDGNASTGSSTEDLCRNRCENKNGVWVADPLNCNGFYYCSNGEPFASVCPQPYHFSEKNQACITPSSSTCVQYSSMCELVPEGTKFRNDKDCTKYNVCSKGEVKSEECKKDNYFDVNSSACKYKDYVYCTTHPVPKKFCETASGVPIVGAKSDGTTCHGYFRCRNLGLVPDLEPVWSQCPKGLFFDEKTQSCTDPVNVLCTHNRCFGRGEMHVQTSSSYCHNFIRCKDNLPLNFKGDLPQSSTDNLLQNSEEECPNDRFFDELTQTCTTRFVEYVACTDQPYPKKK